MPEDIPWILSHNYYIKWQICLYMENIQISKKTKEKPPQSRGGVWAVTLVSRSSGVLVWYPNTLLPVFYSGYSTPSRGRILLKVSSASLKLSQIGFFHPWRTAAILLLLSPCIALRRGFSVAHPLYILIITHILYVVYRKNKKPY